MVISTSGIYQRNIDNFTRQSNEIADIQAQASTGKKDLSLAENLIEIDHLNAAEDHKTQIMQFNKNADMVSSEMNKIDTIFDQLHIAATRLLEIQTQAHGGFITVDNRRMFGIEASSIKNDILWIVW